MGKPRAMACANCVAKFHLFSTHKQPYTFAAQFKIDRIMPIEVKSLEEMPGALSYLIKSVEELKRTMNVLQTKQDSNKPKWMDMDELCAYLPSHPAKQTVYGWVSAKQIPVHKINKALAFLQSEIDEWLKSKSCKSENDLMREAEAFISSKKGNSGAWK